MKRERSDSKDARKRRESAARKKAAPRKAGSTKAAAGKASSRKSAAVKAAAPKAPEKKPARTSAVADKPARTSAGADKPARKAGVAGKPARTTAGADKPARKTGVADKPARTTAGADKPARTTGVADRPARTSGVADKPARTSGVADKPARTTGPADKPARTAAGADKPARTAAVADRPSRKAAPSAPRPRSTRTSAPPAEKVVPAAPRRAAARPGGPAPPARKRDADVTDEERIEQAKYVTGEQPPARRVFEEERFIFPETYGRNRVRLLIKDPQWLFAHWDVDPGVFSGLRAELGERTAALSRLTLKVSDPEHGGGAVIHLPEDARSWYLRTDRVRRAYRAELGLTLPSGEYRLLASSNTVRPPQGSASQRRAAHRAAYVGPRRPGGAAALQDLVGLDSAAFEPGRSSDLRGGGPGPWQPTVVQPAPPGARGGAGDAGEPGSDKGGASDVHRR